MSMFRLVENVPNVYVDQSRDFQVLCSLFDLVQNSTKHQIDSILTILTTEDCPDSLIPLLQTKLGFFVSDQSIYDADTLRRILVVFSRIVRYKGSRLGIEYAINTFISLLKVDGIAHIRIENDNGRYLVVIEISAPFTDARILLDILNYIMPSGYLVEFISVSEASHGTIINQLDTFSIITPGDKQNSSVYNPDDSNLDSYETIDRLNVAGVSTATIYTTESKGDVN